MALNYGTVDDYAISGLPRLGVEGPAGDITLAAFEEAEAWVENAFTGLWEGELPPTETQIKFRLTAGLLGAGKYGYVGGNFALYLKLRD